MSETRSKQFLLAGPEARVLEWIARRLPARVMPDHLTALGVLAAVGIAVAYVLLWLAVAASQRRWRECAALAALLALFTLAMLFHAQAVWAEQLPGDQTSRGWSAMMGPVMPLTEACRGVPLKPGTAGTYTVCRPPSCSITGVSRGPAAGCRCRIGGPLPPLR